MRRVKRILTVPIIFILDLLKIVINLLIKVECWVAGVGFLLLAIFAILALINRMWLQLEIFGILFVLGMVIMLFSTYVLVWIDSVKDDLMGIQ